MSSSQPAQYGKSQILLHWTIAALIAFQLIFGESIEELGEALREGEAPDFVTTVIGNAHIWVGISVLALMAVRIALRLVHGAPAPLPGPRWQHVAAASVHGLLYLLMIIAPVTGLVAWYLGVHLAGEVHEVMKPLFIVLIAAHVLGALWHQFILKDRTLARMQLKKA
ncbi:cytochrome b [Roseibium sp.]|uniref:cytochrome b n=1 Tax=Roseibium sp. TaxID=1936156 RepID=UPI003A98269B